MGQHVAMLRGWDVPSQLLLDIVRCTVQNPLTAHLLLTVPCCFFHHVGFEKKDKEGCQACLLPSWLDSLGNVSVLLPLALQPLSMQDLTMCNY